MKLIIYACLFIFSLQTIAQEGTWEPVTNNPEPRSGAGMVTLPDGRVVLFGGLAEDFTLFNDLHFFKEDTWTRTEITGELPPERANHSMWATDEGEVWIYGGRKSFPEVLGDLWSYDGEAWKKHEPTGEIPDPRGWASTFIWEEKLGIAGGLDASGDLSDVWLYDPNINTWSKWGHIPATLSGASAFEYNGELFFLDSFPWILAGDLADKTWREINPAGDKPSERILAASCKSSNKAFLLGGSGSVLNDMWSFDFEEETWTKMIDLPIPLWGASAAVSENKILLFGGVDDDELMNSNAWLYQFEDPTHIKDSKEDLPSSFHLYQNYPNPFNPTTTIKFTIPGVGNENFRPLRTHLIVYDILGREVATLISENLKPGNYEVKFDAKHLSSGMYYYRISIGDKFNSVKKMVMVK